MDAGTALSKLRAFVSWHAESRDGEGTALLMIADVEHELVTLREAVKAANEAAAKRTPEIAAERDATLAECHRRCLQAVKDAREILLVLERVRIGSLEESLPPWANGLSDNDALDEAANRAHRLIRQWAGQELRPGDCELSDLVLKGHL